MNKEQQYNESEFRRFLLGEMSEAERSEIELQFIADENAFENLRVVEDELIESYVCGTLSGADKIAFESNFLATAKRRERVEFTRKMIDGFRGKRVSSKKIAVVTTNPSWLENVSQLFKQPILAFGSAFALLLLIGGAWFFWRNAEKTPEIARVTPTPSPAVAMSPIASASVLPSPQTVESPADVKQLNKNADNPDDKTIRKEIEANLTRANDTVVSPSPKVGNQPSVVVTLALVVGGIRGEGASNELNLPKNADGANLQLKLEKAEYQNYRAEILDQNGSVIYWSGKLSGKTAKINVFVPSKILKRGDYIVKLYGKNADTREESVADYQFRVNEK